jgi:hypothetical protein
MAWRLINYKNSFTSALTSTISGSSSFGSYEKADQSDRADKGMNRFSQLEHWDRVFESHSRHGCLCVRLF